MSKATIHIVCGPTASGKSARAMELAEELDGVVINCDSMQIYSDLPILTAQPAEDDKARVPHRLYGELHPNEPCSAGNWREMAEPVIKEVLETDQTPIICGGTGLYIKALMDGLSPIPDIPQNVRDGVVRHYEEVGAEAFYAELQERDPVMAARFHVNHKARIIRAMEVLEATGKSLAEWQKKDRLAPPADWDFEIHKIMPERETLRERCDRRFEDMIENGALEEVEAFGLKLENGEVHHNIPLAKALGFSSLWNYVKLKRGIGHEECLDGVRTEHGEKPSLQNAIAQAQAETRQYAKRQVTWFRNQL